MLISHGRRGFVLGHSLVTFAAVANPQTVESLFPCYSRGFPREIFGGFAIPAISRRFGRSESDRFFPTPHPSTLPLPVANGIHRLPSAQQWKSPRLYSALGAGKCLSAWHFSTQIGLDLLNPWHL